MIEKKTRENEREIILHNFRFCLFFLLSKPSNGRENILNFPFISLSFSSVPNKSLWESKIQGVEYIIYRLPCPGRCPPVPHESWTRVETRISWHQHLILMEMPILKLPQATITLCCCWSLSLSNLFPVGLFDGGDIRWTPDSLMLPNPVGSTIKKWPLLYRWRQIIRRAVNNILLLILGYWPGWRVHYYYNSSRRVVESTSRLVWVVAVSHGRWVAAGNSGRGGQWRMEV